MDADRIAKNLLENKLCTNCKYNMKNGCSIDCKNLVATTIENIPPFPSEGTCERWEEKVQIVETIMQVIKAFGGGLGTSSAGFGEITRVAKILEEYDKSLKKNE